MCVSLHGLTLANLFCFSDVFFSLAALKRLKLNSDGHNRVLRALHHKEHHFKHFIRPELLALYSFGPEPSEAVLSLQEINQRSECLSRMTLFILLVGRLLSDGVFILFCRDGDSQIEQREVEEDDESVGRGPADSGEEEKDRIIVQEGVGREKPSSSSSTEAVRARTRNSAVRGGD